jgi:hypothetical protein
VTLKSWSTLVTWLGALTCVVLAGIVAVAWPKARVAYAVDRGMRAVQALRPLAVGWQTALERPWLLQAVLARTAAGSLQPPDALASARKVARDWFAKEFGAFRLGEADAAELLLLVPAVDDGNATVANLAGAQRLRLRAATGGNGTLGRVGARFDGYEWRCVAAGLEPAPPGTNGSERVWCVFESESVRWSEVRTWVNRAPAVTGLRETLSRVGDREQLIVEARLSLAAVADGGAPAMARSQDLPSESTCDAATWRRVLCTLAALAGERSRPFEVAEEPWRRNRDELGKAIDACTPDVPADCDSAVALLAGRPWRELLDAGAFDGEREAASTLPLLGVALAMVLLLSLALAGAGAAASRYREAGLPYSFRPPRPRLPAVLTLLAACTAIAVFDRQALTVSIGQSLAVVAASAAAASLCLLFHRSCQRALARIP